MINWARVTELRAEIGADDFQEVVDLFLEEVEETLCALPSQTDAKGLESAFHFLKGSALNLGFRAMSALCQAGEAGAAQGQTDVVNPDEVQRVYDRSKSEFIAGMQDRFAA